MTTFSKASFDFTRYAAARPTYPRQLFDFVLEHHGRARSARWDLAIDVGCGTGQATVELTSFKRVLGVDPSAGMIDKARAYASQRTDIAGAANIEFAEASAEALPVSDGAADLVVAAQAAHWFDWAKVWPEVARVLRPNGSAAFWGYSEFRLSAFPQLTPLISEYSNGKDPAASLGPHWQQPGRGILDGHLLAVPRATDMLPDAFTDWEHVFFTGDHYPSLPSPRPVLLRKRMSWSDLHAYFRTFSSLHTFLERNPAERDRADGDIADRFLARLKKETGEPEQIDVEWPMALLLVRRK